MRTVRPVISEGAVLTTLIHPDRRFLFAHPAHFLALGFGSGLMRPAPGTWGTLVALPLAWLWFRFGGSPFLLVLLCLPFFGLGAWRHMSPAARWACTIMVVSSGTK